MNNRTSKAKIQIEQQNIDIYKKKVKYFGSKALLYGCLLSIIFRKPKTFFPISIGIAAGFCHEDLKNIFFNPNEEIESNNN